MPTLADTLKQAIQRHQDAVAASKQAAADHYAQTANPTGGTSK